MPFWTRSKAREPEPLPRADRPLLYLPAGEIWTARDAFSGTLVTGATGTGKTSGPGKNLALNMMKEGWGGLVLAAKEDEADLWREYAELTGREEELLVVDDSYDYRFNFMKHAVTTAKSRHALTLNLVGLYGSVMEAISAGEDKTDDYWTKARDQLLNNAFDALLCAYGTVDLEMVDNLVMSAPTSPDQVHDASWLKESYCIKVLTVAKKNAAKDDDDIGKRSVQQSMNYFLKEFPGLADRTRTSIVSTFRSASDLLLRGVLWKLFCTDTNYVPELCRKGIILVMDLPVLTLHNAGIIAQVLVKYAWQRAMQAKTEGESRPVFLFMDEYHYFAVEADSRFVSTARSSEIATVAMFQNLPILETAFGGGARGEQAAAAFTGNLRTRIFGANGEEKTNQWASATLGQGKQRLHSGGSSTSYQEETVVDLLISGRDTAGYSEQAGFSEQILPFVQPAEFTQLRTGGPGNGCLVDTILFKTGATFQNGHAFLPVSFSQNPEHSE